MAAVPRDPMFWRRFSRAVHISEAQATSAGQATTAGGEQAQYRPTTSSSALSGRASPAPKPSDDWLVTQRRKARRQKARYCAGILAIIVFLAAVVLVLIWGSRHVSCQD